SALQTKLRRLIHNEPRLGERIDVWPFEAIARRLFKAHRGHPRIVSRDKIREIVEYAASKVPGHKFSLRFILSEWEDVVDAWQLESWEAYRDVRRLGRKTRLPEQQRALLWSIFERVREMLAGGALVTYARFFSILTTIVAESRKPPFDFVVVDEAQDLGVPHLRLLAALGGSRPNALFFAGDLGQRIFQQPFSWLALGVDVRGRSRTLRVNYRTSHQIRTQADRLLGPELTDVDGNKEDRRGTVSVFDGPPPHIRAFSSDDEESEAICAWLRSLSDEGIQAHEVGVFVRSSAQVPRASAAVRAANLS